MQIGKLRQRVTIETAAESADAAGQMIKTWTTSSTVWASIEPLLGYERYAAQQSYAGVSHRVRVRYLSTLTPACRFAIGARYLDINAVINPAERDAEMECLCTEVL